MIYEIRAYRLKVGSLAELEKRYADAYQARKKYSELAGFFHTEIGPVNEITHIWPYESFEERSRIRAAAAKDPNWPPKIQEFITAMNSEILIPFPFAPSWKPGKLGPIYEYRHYTFKAGALPRIMERWEAKLPGRLALSPLALAGHIEMGVANKFVHIWAYASLEQRGAIRAKARETGIWPPPGGADDYLTQDTKIMMPSVFSPAQ